MFLDQTAGTAISSPITTAVAGVGSRSVAYGVEARSIGAYGFYGGVTDAH